MQRAERFRVQEPSQVGAARRSARAAAIAIGLDEDASERTALVVTELGTNLVKHSPGGGELILLSGEGVKSPSAEADPPEIAVLALDHGPGTDNVGRWRLDGFSTAGSPGTGLGAIERLADAIDIHSSRASGTAVLARLRSRSSPSARRDRGDDATRALRIGGLAIPVESETVCGDAWTFRRGVQSCALVVADGLGHGPDAATAAVAATAVFEAETRAGGEIDTARLLDAMASPLQETRGAAVAVAVVDLAGRSVRFAGIGNIAAAIVSDAGQRGLVSHNGIVGHAAPPARELRYEWPAGSTLIVHSDGLKSRWSLEPYAGLTWRDPDLVAGVLYRDFSRGRDDVTIVVVGEREAGK